MAQRSCLDFSPSRPVFDSWHSPRKLILSKLALLRNNSKWILQTPKSVDRTPKALLYRATKIVSRQKMSNSSYLTLCIFCSQSKNDLSWQSCQFRMSPELTPVKKSAISIGLLQLTGVTLVPDLTCHIVTLSVLATV